MDPRVTWLVTAMKTWSPDYLMPHKDVSHYESVAQDVFDVVTDPAEPALPLAGADPTKVKTMLQVLGVARMESSFWPSVDDGTCNGLHPEKTDDIDLLKKAGMNCDSKAAWSLWQIHTDFPYSKGLWLTAEGITTMGGTGPAITGPDLIKNRKLAVRVALHLMRMSIKAKIGLCGYSGEKYSETAPDHGCPLAEKRVAVARDYYKEHPYAP